MEESVKIAAQSTTELTQRISSIQSDIIEAIESNGHDMQAVSAKGEELLSHVASTGMNDELDTEVAQFIREARSTSKQMNDRRKVVTQVFDKIRKGFTLMESVLDPKVSDSVIYKLQIKRDEYAAWKLEQQRKAEAERQRLARIAQAKADLATATKNICMEIAHKAKADALYFLNKYFSELTLDNVEKIRYSIKDYNIRPCIDVELRRRIIPRDELINSQEANHIINTAYLEVSAGLLNDYDETVKNAKQDLLDRFDSKVAELQEIARAEEERKRLEAEAAKAAAEERTRLEAEAAKRRAEEEQRRAEIAAAEEEQRREQERQLEEQRKLQEEQAKIAQADASMNALFEQKEYIATPVNAKVTKHIEITDSSAFADVIQMWWSHVGASLSIAELSKRLGFMVKACEKLANDSDIVITNNNVLYVEDVKAK